MLFPTLTCETWARTALIQERLGNWGAVLIVLDLSERPLLGCVLLFLLNFESEIISVLDIISGSSQISFVLSLCFPRCPHRHCYCINFEETSVKPNPIFRVKFLCMCEVHTHDKEKLKLDTVRGPRSWGRKEMPWDLADVITIKEVISWRQLYRELFDHLVHTMGVVTNVHSHSCFTGSFFILRLSLSASPNQPTSHLWLFWCSWGQCHSAILPSPPLSLYILKSM